MLCCCYNSCTTRSSNSTGTGPAYIVASAVSAQQEQFCSHLARQSRALRFSTGHTAQHSTQRKSNKHTKCWHMAWAWILIVCWGFRVCCVCYMRSHDRCMAKHIARRIFLIDGHDRKQYHIGEDGCSNRSIWAINVHAASSNEGHRVAMPFGYRLPAIYI